MRSKVLLRSALWLIIVLCLFAGLFHSYQAGRIKLQTDFLALLPATKSDPLEEEAFTRVTKRTGQKIMIFVGNKDQALAGKAAAAFYDQLARIPALSEIQFTISRNVQEDFLSYYFPYRYHLLSQEDRTLLEKNQGTVIQKKAQSSLYSPIGMGLTGLLPQDPFQLFSNYVLGLPFINTGLFPQGGMLTAQDGNEHYIFLSATLTANALDASADFTRTVEEIYAASRAIEKKFPGTQFLFSGFVFHSHAGATASMRELDWIGTFSLLGVIFLMLLNYRSFKPLLLAMFSIGVGFLAGTSLTLLIFKQLHVLTLVFGTSLIGSSADYTLLFFAEHFNKKESHEGTAIIKRIWPGLTWGMGTSVIGYLALLIAPFPGLQQIAVYSTAGLIGAYLTVILLFPLFKINLSEDRTPPCLPFANKLAAFWQEKLASKKNNTVIIILLVLFIAFGISRIRTNDNIRLLFSSPRHLLESERVIRRIIKTSPDSQYFLIRGTTPQQVLEKEEALMPSLNGLIADKKLSSFQAIAQVIPSLKQQKMNYVLVQKKLYAPYLQEQARFLGLNAKQLAKIKQEFSRQKNSYLDIQAWLKSPQGRPFEFLWLGQIGEKYASVIMLSNIKSIPELEKIAGKDPAVRLINKMSDITDMFRHYRHSALALGAGAYLLILLLLRLHYNWRKAAVILVSPVLASLLTVAILGYSGSGLNLFNVLGLILILSMGIDYTLFFAEGLKQQETTGLGVFLAAATTAISFGLLALSSTPLINSFGITILLGIVFAYLLSPLITCFKEPDEAPRT